VNDGYWSLNVNIAAFPVTTGKAAFVVSGGQMLKHMKADTNLKPGQKGSKRLMEHYGDALLCVRYRTDEKRGLHLKTVELIVGEKPLPGYQYWDGDMVNLVVVYGEASLRDRLKALGGRWNPAEKLWQIPFEAIRGNAELEDRIVPSAKNVVKKR
jgi:hypothetical protein